MRDVVAGPIQLALEYRTGPMKSGGQLATSLLLSEGGYFDLG